MFQELPENPQQNQKHNDVNDASLLINGLNYAVNVEILQIVSESLRLNRQSEELDKRRAHNELEFYNQVLERLDTIISKGAYNK